MSSVNQRFEEMKKKFPIGSLWSYKTVYSSPNCDCTFIVLGYACYGGVERLQARFFGSDPSVEVFNDLNSGISHGSEIYGSCTRVA